MKFEINMKRITQLKKLLCTALLFAAYNNYIAIKTGLYSDETGDYIDWEEQIKQLGELTPEDIESLLDLTDVDFGDEFDFDGIPIAETFAPPMKDFDPEVIGPIIAELDPLGILEKDFYLHTNPLAKRSELDQPLFEQRPQFSCYDNSLTFHLFGRKAKEYDFTAKSVRANQKRDRISSYLALEEETLIGRLQSSVDIIKDLIENDEFFLDIDRVFGLFRNTRIEMRHVGLMGDYYRNFSNWRFHVMTPFYYLERNFFLTEKEQIEIEKEFGTTTKAEQKEFRKAHAISDKLGFGDTRIEIDTPIYCGECALMQGGFQFTVPTAFTVAKNFAGSSFEQKSTLPVINFEEIFDLACDPNNEANAKKLSSILSELALDASDRLAANLIDTKLGNDGHVGFGAFIRGRGTVHWLLPFAWVEQLIFTNRISLEYLTPAYERRSFIVKINEEKLNAIDFDQLAMDDAESALQLVEELLIKRIFLRGFDTLVQPGIIFRYLSKMTYEGDKWNFGLGTDFYFQSKEHFISIDVAESIKRNLDIEKTKNASIWQAKLHARLMRNLYCNCYDAKVWLGVDGNIGQKGLANDFGISIGFDWSF